MISNITPSLYQHQTPRLKAQKPGHNNVVSFQAKEKQEKKPFIFIAMPMPDGEERKKWNNLNKIIKKLACYRGAKAGRIDDLVIKEMESKTNNFIEHDIMREIDNSDIVIADVTEPNPNVYFEMGYALGKNKKIIPIAVQGTHLPFDTRNIYTIFYEKPDKKQVKDNSNPDLQKKLGRILSNVLKNIRKNNDNQ